MAALPDDLPPDAFVDDDDERAHLFAALESGELLAATGQQEAPRERAKGTELKGDARPDDGKGGARLHPIDGGRKDGKAQRAPVLERGDDAELADLMLAQLRKEGTGAIVHDEGNLYQYDPASGLWKVIDADRQGRIVKSYAGRPMKADKLGLRVNHGTIIGTTKVAAIVARNNGFFWKAPEGIAFRNGFVQVERNGLRPVPHVPDNRARWGYSFDYDPSAPAPRWFDYLNDLFRDDFDKAERFAFVQEWGGIALVGAAPRFGRAFVTIGRGDNGKSTLGTILAGVMPEGTVCHVSPHDWYDDYALAMLRGKLLNIVAELPARDFAETDRIKAVITGDPIKARPIRMEPFVFAPKAGHYISANDLPGTADNSSAFLRRWVVLNIASVVDPAKKNVNLAAEILAEETPGIVAWLLQGASCALQQGSYTIPPSSTMRVQEWQQTGDSVSLFIHEKYVKIDQPRGKEGTSAEPLYNEYRDFAKRGGFVPVSIKTFKGRMDHLQLSVRHTNEGSKYPVRARTPYEHPYPVQDDD